MPFTLYRSSAGSGKTYTLVKEYLKIILDNPENFRNILAVTFTNKAAEEMKDRIMLALKRLAKREDPVLEKTLLAEMKQPIKSLGGISHDILTTLLHNYSDIALMTIDSFIHKVLRAFALEVGLPLKFTIEMNYERIQSHVVERLLAEVGKDEHITETVMAFVFHRAESGRSWNIENDIRNFSMQLFNEKNYEWTNQISSFEPELLQRFSSQLKHMVTDFLGGLHKLGNKGLGQIKRGGLTVQDFPYKSSGAAGVLEKCAGLSEQDMKTWSMGKRFREGVWIAKSMPPDIKSGVERVLENGLAQTAEELLVFYDSGRPPALTAAAILDNIFLAAFLKRIKELVDDYKKKNNAIPIAEFNVKVNQIVRNSPTPFIYSMLGERYHHYLIDEFQDTSRLQWENLFPLIDNAMASAYFNMAVGDGKQSIYRWRGGDVEVMENDIKTKIFPGELDIRALDANYRSRDAVVAFNNDFFEHIREGSGEHRQFLGEIYSSLKQIPKGRPGGFVSLQLLDEGSAKRDDSGEGTEGNVSAADGLSDTDSAGDAGMDTAICGRTKAIIDHCLEAGYNQQDLAILVRENKKAQIIAEYLLKSGIQVVSPDSVNLARVPFIRFMLDMLGCLNNPADKIKEASFIHYLCMYGLENPHSPDVIGLQLLENNQLNLSAGLEMFYKKRNHLIRMPVYEVVEELIRMFKLADFPEFKTPGYLQAFLDITARYMMENSVDLSSFLDWWEFNKGDFSLVVPENKEAVKIMTIHKAKGLEFPVVIIPYADWEYRTDKQMWLRPNPLLATDPKWDMPMPVNKNAWLEETYFREALEEEKGRVFIDNINLLYVAFTRAVDQLYILCRRKEKNENFMHLKEYAVPMMTSCPGEAGAENYTYGAPLRKEEGSEPILETRFDTVQDLISRTWSGSITIRRKARDFWVFRRDENRGERRHRGVLIHQILARMMTRDDLPAILADLRINGELNGAQEKEMAKLIGKLLAHPQAGRWFEPGAEVFCEAPLIVGDSVLRPDRVIFNNGVATVIDFKTGGPHSAHTEQIRTYKKAVAEAGEFRKVEGFLFYLDKVDIREID